MRIAIFGSRGFIGKEFVHKAPKGCELYLFNRPDADVTKPETFSEKLKEFHPDVVVNLAARIGNILKSVSVQEMFSTNMMGALNVAYASREAGAKVYAYTSSTVVYGENEKGQHHNRFDNFAPKHPYSASKAAAEYALQQFVKEEMDGDMSVVTLRPPQVIGEDSKLLLPPVEFVRDILQGRNIQLFGDGLHEREYVSVGDVARGIWKAVEWSINNPKGYNPFFLTGNRISMRDLADKAVEKFGGKVIYVPKTSQTFSLTTNPSDSKTEFGWEVENNLDWILDDVMRFSLKKF